MMTEKRTHSIDATPYDELDLLRLARRERARFVRDSVRHLAGALTGRGRH